MSFSWPWALLALLVIPLVFAAWWLTRRRRRRAVVRVTSIALVRTAMPGRSRWRRRIPAVLLTLGLAVLAVGAARPQATVPVASSSATIMLALDVSGSMCSTDVKPNRITAAEQAATAFIKSQTGGPRIGLVAFASTAVVLVPPTADTRQLLSALGGLTTSFGTAIGEGILTSLDAIAQVDRSVAPTGVTVARDRGAGYADDVIVVLTDGSNNRGIDPQTAAKEAAGRGVRVFTIGYGTDNPAPLACSSAQFGGFGGVGFGFGGRPGGEGNPFDADYGALMQISRTTGGTFYRAQDADQLSRALAKLPAAFTIVRKHIDIASAFAAGGGLLIAAAVALSLWWNRTRRMPDPARIADHLPRAVQFSAWTVRRCQRRPWRGPHRQRPRVSWLAVAGPAVDQLSTDADDGRPGSRRAWCTHHTRSEISRTRTDVVLRSPPALRLAGTGSLRRRAPRWRGRPLFAAGGHPGRLRSVSPRAGRGFGNAAWNPRSAPCCRCRTRKSASASGMQPPTGRSRAGTAAWSLPHRRV